MPSCPVEKVEEMLAGALSKRRRGVIPASENLWWLSVRISLQLDADNPGLTEREITRAEVLDGRESVAKIEAILAKAIGRLERVRDELAAPPANGTADAPEFIASEIDAYESFGRKLAGMRDGLSTYQHYFSLSTMRPIRWQAHAKEIHEAFLVLVPDSQGEPWGISEDGPAVAFVRLALEYVLSFIKAVAQPTLQLPSKRSIADALRQSRKLVIPRPG